MLFRHFEGLFLRNSCEGNNAANFTARYSWCSTGAQHCC